MICRYLVFPVTPPCLSKPILQAPRERGRQETKKRIKRRRDCETEKEKGEEKKKKKKTITLILNRRVQGDTTGFVTPLKSIVEERNNNACRKEKRKLKKID